MTEGRPSLQQEPLWFLDRVEPESNAYHVAFALVLDEVWGEAELSRALEVVLLAQESLRISFPTIDGRARLQVAVEVPWALERLGSEDVEVQAFVDRPFELSTAPLFRWGWVAERRELVCVFHHIVFDGASVQIFIDELSRALRGQALVEATESMGAFAERQRTWMNGTGAEAARAHWREALTEAPLFELPADLHADRSVSGPRRRMLAEGLPSRVQDFAREHKVTPFMVLLAVFEWVLGRRAGLEDVSVGTPVSLRMDPRIRDRIGLFVNSVVVRAQFEDDPTFLELLARVKQACMAAFRHHALPFAHVVQTLAPARSLDQNPLFSCMFILQEEPKLAVDGPFLEHRELTASAPKFDLTAAVAIGAGGYELSVEAREDKYDEHLSLEVMEAFETALHQVIGEPDRPVSKTLAPPPPRFRPHVSPSPRPIHLRFADRAHRRPDEAVIRHADGGTTSAGQLWARARSVAAGLVERGFGPGSRIGVALPPSLDALSALLGIFDIGAAFIALDVTLPTARLEGIIADAEVEAVILGPESRGRFTPPEHQVAGLLREASDRPSHEDLEALAYVMFTSGSTGRPKGVEIRQESLTRFIDGFARGVELPTNAVWAGLSHLAFDISLLELFLPLVEGGCVQVVPPELGRNGPRLAEFLDAHQVDIIQTTPTRWRMLLAGGWKGRAGQVAFTGGERLTVELARALQERTGHVVNLYGPTETTVWSTARRVTRSDLERPDTAQIPIGLPLPGVRLHVLDRFGHPVPSRVPGQLHLAGPNLGRGYVGQEELTKAAWRPAPAVGEERVYATGDRVRWVDGELEFLGRRDDQVKVRGHRIELGEVQACMRNLPEVGEAAVKVGRTETGDHLWGYIVPKPGCAPSGTRCREQLRETLPEAWLPSVISVMGALPKTPSGKIDVRALPAPEEDAGRGARVRTLLEGQIAGVWADLFGLAEVSRDADFFALGGQSVLAVELAARLEKRLERNISVMDIFHARTVDRLAARLELGGLVQPWRSLVAYRPSGEAKPLFIIDAGALRELSAELDAELPVFALNFFGEVPESGPVPRLTIPELAARFVEEIRCVQAHGPYRLLAYCGDTKLLVEMARQLEAEGEEVGFFGAIDVIGNAQHDWSWAQAAGLLWDYGLDYPRALIHRRRRYYRLSMARALARVADLSDRVTGRRPSKQQRNDLFYAAYLRALAAYQPQGELRAPITFLVCTEYLRRTSPASLRALAQGRARVEEIPGFHDSILTAPWVKKLAERLSALLL